MPNVKTTTDPKSDHGLQCRACGCRHLRVVFTRGTWGNQIKRRRECRNCGKRVTTLEK